MEFFSVLLQQDGQQPLFNFLIGVPQNTSTNNSPTKLKVNGATPKKNYLNAATKTATTPKTTPIKPSPTKTATSTISTKTKLPTSPPANLTITLQTPTTPATKQTSLPKPTSATKPIKQTPIPLAKPTPTSAKKVSPTREAKPSAEPKRNWTAIVGKRIPSKEETVQILKYVVAVFIHNRTTPIVATYNEIAIEFLRETGGARTGGFSGLGYGKLQDILKMHCKASLPEGYKFAKRTGLERVGATPAPLSPTVAPSPPTIASAVLNGSHPPAHPPDEPAKPVTPEEPASPAKPVKLTYFQARKLAQQSPSSATSPPSPSPSPSTTESSPSKPPPVSSPSTTTTAKRTTYTSRYYQDKAAKAAPTSASEVSPKASPVKPNEKEEVTEQKKDFTSAIATKKFIEAVVKGRITDVKKAVQQLNQMGIKVVNCIKVAESKNNQFPWVGWTPMHITAWNGSSDVLQYLLSTSETDKIDVNVRNTHEQTPLHIAALRGQFNAAKTLLEYGAEVDALNSRRFNQTPLHIAALKGHSDIVELLEQHQAAVARENGNTRGPKSALMFAAEGGYTNIVEDILRQNPKLADISENSNDLLAVALQNGNKEVASIVSGKSTLSIGKQIQLAITYKQAEVVELLLQKVRDMDELMKNESINFYRNVAYVGDKKVLEVLLAKSAKAVSVKPKTAINSGASDEFLEALLKAGARDETSYTGTNALSTAISMKNEGSIKVLLRYLTEFGVSDTNGNSILHLAASKGLSREVVAMLITTSKIQVDIENTMGQTPLQTAASRGFSELVEEFVKFRADVNKANPKKNHQTALHYAADKGDPKSLSVLIRHGANVNAETTKSPFNALGMCVEKRHREAEDLLRAAGAKETTKKAPKNPQAGRLQLMTFTDAIPPQFEYKPISLIERQALTQNQSQQEVAKLQTANVANHSSSALQQRPWKTARIFISSSFKDMHGERSYIVNHVMPLLRKKCAQRKVHVMEVDLRWGVTEEEAQTGKVLELCLEEVNRCNVS